MGSLDNLTLLSNEHFDIEELQNSETRLTMSDDTRDDMKTYTGSVTEAMKNPKLLCCLLCLAFAGAAVLATGIAIFFFLPEIMDNMVEKHVILAENSRSYESWSELDFPMESEFYVFNVTNPQDVLNGSKPIIEERGPYIYRQRMSREKIVFNDDGTVSYDLVPLFYFDRQKSVGPESDTFTTLNIPVVTVNHGMRFMSGMSRLIAESLLHLDNEALFLNLTLSELLWGYQDSFVSRMTTILPTIGQDFPEYFGLMYQKNNSKMGSYRIESGKNDITKLGSILTWNGEGNLSQWTTDQCRMINGSDGTIFPPFVGREQTLYFYNPFYCRSFPMIYQNESKIKHLDTFQFVLPSSAFASPAENPANEGFCTPLGNCPPSGLINISHCNEGSPVLLSQPHFLDADPTLHTAMEGLRPDPKRHHTAMQLEPETGVLLKSTQRTQFNIYVNKNFFREPKNFDYFYLPISWLAVNVDSGKLAKEIEESLYEPKAVAEALTYAAMGVGAFILLCSIVFAAIQISWKNKRNDLYGFNNNDIVMEKNKHAKEML